ncbi:ABC transporter permease [Temperatibacter marinus]|uniref:ABC transporter permease n=1 Tax=Temperatibacter marinus TaxID=1456591 RepID=A0AA52H8B3_9PROT|nr:ABC transporter permease [Temperatibacter marinus]WND01659.1 ABC transporter permease [Temperatibacter marinus]
MFQNYVLIALRNLKKNKLYALINIMGLAIGLTIFMFGGILADYELNHDTMFAQHKRIYTVGATLHPNANIGVQELSSTYTAMAPLIQASMSDDVEAVARTVRRGYLASAGDKHFNETIRFMDKELLAIFDFVYLEGNSRALADPKGAVLSRDQAIKMFGRLDIVGKTIMLDHTHDLTVRAVIENLPENSHFLSSIIDTNGYNIFAPLESLNRIDDWDLQGNWNNLSMGNNVYVLTKKPMDIDELTAKINTVFVNNVDPEIRENFMTAQTVRPISKANSSVWDAIGIPAIEIVLILGTFVLIIAIVNYTNLAAAQSMGRVREVGMRKTLGADRKQLLIQFLVESITIVSIAMIISLVILEVLVPSFNASLGRVVTLNYGELLPWLLLITLGVGLLAGLYPAFLITRVNPIEALKQMTMKGARGSLFRSVMIGLQFTLSILMLAMVMIIYFQNKKVEDASQIFPKDEVLTLTSMSKQSIRDREDTLKLELMKLPDVEQVTFASQVPFEQSNNQRSVSRIEGDENNRLPTNVLYTAEGFLPTFDIKLLAGRNFERGNSGDIRLNREDRDSNVIINELLATRLGYKNAQEAVGQSFYGRPGELAAFRYNIIGVVETQNILGLHNEVKAWIFMNDWDPHFYGAIRIKKGAPASVIKEIEETWKAVIPDYPIEHQFLNAVFEGIYNIFRTLNMVITMFAAVALSLALIGLFGLAAFMARGRTKEIGIRKVLGASVSQLIRMMLLQFSKPVIVSLLIALPLTYFLAGQYLNLFSDRIDTLVPITLLAGFSAIFLSWSVIALHAMRVARSNPILALRYE